MVKVKPVIVCGLVAVMAAIVWLLVTDIALGPTLMIVVALAIQTATGGWVWAALRRRSGAGASAIEILAMGCAIGTVLAMVSGVLLRPLIPMDFAWAAPTVVLLAFLIIARRANAIVEPRVSSPIRWPSLPVAAAVGLRLWRVGARRGRKPNPAARGLHGAFQRRLQQRSVLPHRA